MTTSQRSALSGMMSAILAVDHCPPDIRARAEALQAKLSPFAALMRLFGH